MLYVLKKETPAKATIVNRGGRPCLLADFYLSEPPVIWQLDLKKNATFQLKLKQDEQGEWDLGLETDRDAFKSVAHFDERGEAEDSYAIVQNALDRGEVKFYQKVLRVLLYVVLLYIGLNIIGALISIAKKDTNAELATQQQIESGSGIQQGVPLAADDVLSAPPN